MLTTTVSSKMLSSMAKSEGFYFEETLTGFKWLGNAATELKKKGYDPFFAYEEAIGFMIGDVVMDKDGISALATFGELLVQLEKRNISVKDYLEELYQNYGYFLTDNSYFICHSQPTMDEIFDKIRYGENPTKPSDSDYPYSYQLSYPTTLAGYKVTYVRDLTIGYDTSRPDKKPTLPVSESSHMITFGLENGGTEPKIKYYFELSGTDREKVKMELKEIVKRATNVLLEPEKYGLGYRK
ncbi:5799_t:CDS:2 [Acaulospora colombiana]|uniref:5799_t:CDS:1 n=1 Tax=Acaulospora colombiana TaxID=27376 RepID=A0ACA9KL36_9GLOM|nr:5799_t:CDS:2 [Acaulospora colombiana]